MLYAKMLDFQNLYDAHLAARKGKRNKGEVIRFEMNLGPNLCVLKQELSENTYTPRGYKHFMVYEPKARSIYAPDYADRVVQHCLCDNIVRHVLEPRLIYDNAACRVSKGTHFSMRRLSGFMSDLYQKFGCKGYFLKCDIKKYFANINHEVLKQKLIKVFDDEVYRLLCVIINSYENTPDTGIPLGNQTSQWFALYYLDVVDRYIKEKLHIKYYVRYMDDFVLLHQDKEYLKQCRREIERICNEHLKIDLNQKTQIFPVQNGVDYLGWHFYLTPSGKVIKKLKSTNKRRLKRHIKLLQRDYQKHLINFAAVQRSLVSTQGHLMHGHTFRFREKLYRQTVFTRG